MEQRALTGTCYLMPFPCQEIFDHVRWTPIHVQNIENLHYHINVILYDKL